MLRNTLTIHIADENNNNVAGGAIFSAESAASYRPHHAHRHIDIVKHKTKTQGKIIYNNNFSAFVKPTVVVKVLFIGNLLMIGSHRPPSIPSV